MAMAEEIHVALHEEPEAPTIGHSGVPESAELETQLVLHAKPEALQTVSQRGDYEFADLAAHLALQSDFVKKNIKHLLYQEYARSFKNVVGQWAVFRNIMADLVAVNHSPEAEVFRQLVREIHPARMASLQNSADSIDQEMSELKELITNEDFKPLESRLKRLGAKAADGAQKYKELQPKLLKLWLRYEEEAAKCEHAGQVSQDLLTQTEQHRDRWFWFLDFLGKSAAIGSASLFLGSATSIGYLYHLYQAKAAAMGLAKAKYAAAQKALAEKSVTVHAAAAEAKAAQAVAAHDHAAVISANHALQAGSGTGVATTVSSVHAGPKAVVGVAGCSAALGVYLVHSVDMAQAAYQAASTVADAASAAAGAAHSAMSGAAAEAASALSNISSQQVAMTSLSTTMCSIAPMSLTAGIVLALCMIGYAGRDAVKGRLGRLWEKELKQHQEMRDLFLGRAQILRDVCGKLMALHKDSENVDYALEDLEIVANDLADKAKYYDIDFKAEELDEMEQEVDKLAESLTQAAAALSAFQDSLKEASEMHQFQVTLLSNDAHIPQIAQQPLLGFENGSKIHGEPPLDLEKDNETHGEAMLGFENGNETRCEAPLDLEKDNETHGEAMLGFENGNEAHGEAMLGFENGNETHGEALLDLEKDNEAHGEAMLGFENGNETHGEAMLGFENGSETHGEPPLDLEKDNETHGEAMLGFENGNETHGEPPLDLKKDSETHCEAMLGFENGSETNGEPPLDLEKDNETHGEAMLGVANGNEDHVEWGSELSDGSSVSSWIKLT